ncbi:MAG: NAD(P)H-hydrate dehydratase, partial [Chloroflexi bacterium]|nr:NAD(P)H-hydrate dehydratase [Chloroflexota bacterium]
AGLVTLATTVEVQRIVAASLHEATYLPLHAHDGAIANAAARTLLTALVGYDALLIGPGLGRARSTQHFLFRVLDARERLPRLVVDADGLNALGEQREWWRMVPPGSVLTPHIGEFARLTGLSADEINANREACAREHAQRWNVIIVLKGAFTLVAEPSGHVTLLPFANPALATAGSGDVLAGIIVGLMAQGLSARDAAVAGGYVHGVTGDILRADVGNAGALAGDLLERIPRALKQLCTAKSY